VGSALCFPLFHAAGKLLSVTLPALVVCSVCVRTQVAISSTEYLGGLCLPDGDLGEFLLDC
jgi:hypothetical protein